MNEKNNIKIEIHTIVKYNNKECELYDLLNGLIKRNEELHSIIKEVREYTKSHFKQMVADEEAQKLLEILDKVG